MKLLIVESPTKAKTISKYLKGFHVVASVGHIIDLPENKLSIDVENDFKPDYKVIKGKEKVIEKIEKEASSATEVYIGSDPDREGEAIAWHVASLIKDKEPRRVLFHEITKKGIIDAIENYTEIDEKLFNSQQARRILDRIVGYRLSPFLWFSIKKGLSAGRVQSVALKIVVDREREIAAFKPEEYWTVKADFKSIENILDASLEKIKGKKAEIKNASEAEKIKSEIENALDYRVISVEKKQKKESPLPPFTTSLLQQEAAKKYHFPTDKTMKVAQSLYEGKDVGEEAPVGLITYMRTDSFRISDDANKELRDFIKDIYSKDYLSPSVRKFKNKKGNTQDAHEAIRPTNVSLTPEKIKSYLTTDEYKLYLSIWTRFVATQMKDALFNKTAIDISDSKNNFLFRKTGSILIFDGFRKVYSTKTADELLPEIAENTSMNIENILTQQHFTKPPARFNDGSLVKELEEKGIGRPSTYASIIKNITLRKYIERLTEPKGAFGATELGMLVSDTLQKHFADIINVKFTAKMEEDLDLIAEGQLEWLDLMNTFYTPFVEKLEGSFSNVREKGRDELFAEEPCPKCGSRLKVKFSKKTNNSFLGCENWPKCKFAGQIEKIDGVIHLKKTDENDASQNVNEELDEKCPKCGKPMVIKNGRYGLFKACSGYPECKHIENIEAPVSPCPIDGCDGKVTLKRTKRGKPFYGCSNYPKCEFVSWYKPIENEICPHCGKSYIIEKKTGKFCEVCKQKIEETEKDGKNNN